MLNFEGIQRLKHNGQYDAALEQCEQLLAQTPEDSKRQVQILKANVLFYKNDIDGAFKVLDGLTPWHGNKDILMLAARCHGTLGNYDTAILMLNLVLNDDINDDYYLLKAQIFYLDKRIKGAQAALSKINDYANTDAILLRARIYREENKHREAINLCLAYRGSRHDEVYVALAESYKQLEQTYEESWCYLKAYQFNQQNPKAAFYLAKKQLNQRNYYGVIEILYKPNLLEFDSIKLALAIAFNSVGQYQHSLEVLSKHTTKQGKTYSLERSAALFNIGLVQGDDKLVQEAYECIEPMKSEKARLLKAEILAAQGHYAKAAEVFPNGPEAELSPRALALKAECLYKTHRFELVVAMGSQELALRYPEFALFYISALDLLGRRKKAFKVSKSTHRGSLELGIQYLNLSHLLSPARSLGCFNHLKRVFSEEAQLEKLTHIYDFIHLAACWLNLNIYDKSKMSEVELPDDIAVIFQQDLHQGKKALISGADMLARVIDQEGPEAWHMFDVHTGLLPGDKSPESMEKGRQRLYQGSGSELLANMLQAQTYLQGRQLELAFQVRHDFTINTVFINEYGTLVDVSGTGVEDYQNKILRTFDDPSECFNFDNVKVLDAISFAAEGYQFGPMVENSIRAWSPNPAHAQALYWKMAFDIENLEYDLSRVYMYIMQQLGVVDKLSTLFASCGWEWPDPHYELPPQGTVFFDPPPVGVQGHGGLDNFAPIANSQVLSDEYAVNQMVGFMFGQHPQNQQDDLEPDLSQMDEQFAQLTLDKEVPTARRRRRDSV